MTGRSHGSFGSKGECKTGRYAKIDLSAILDNPYAKDAGKICYNKKNVFDFQLEKTVDEKILLKQFKDALENQEAKRVYRSM